MWQNLKICKKMQQQKLCILLIYKTIPPFRTWIHWKTRYIQFWCEWDYFTNHCLIWFSNKIQNFTIYSHLASDHFLLWNTLCHSAQCSFPVHNHSVTMLWCHKVSLHETNNATNCATSTKNTDYFLLMIMQTFALVKYFALFVVIRGLLRQIQ